MKTFTEEDLKRMADKYGPSSVGQRIMDKLEKIDPAYHWKDGKVSKEREDESENLARQWAERKSTLATYLEYHEQRKQDIKGAVKAEVGDQFNEETFEATFRLSFSSGPTG
jgi:hypothetical protein